MVRQKGITPRDLAGCAEGIFVLDTFTRTDHGGLMRKPLRIAIFGLCLAFGVTGCAGLNGARPLAPGQHELGVTFGGGMVMFAGAPIPLPNLIVEGRSGVAKLADRPLDLNYGLNLTALPFGILQMHLGASWLLAHPKGAVPAVSMSQRLWFATNAPASGYKYEGAVGAWGAHQIEFTASWMLGNHLLYVALAQYTAFTNPQLTLTPALGATFDPGAPGGFKLQVETRWYSINHTQPLQPFTFVPDGMGSLGVSVAFSHTF